jgi:hypothetical protein
MSDLRGKLLMILAEYGRGYDTFAAADRILALLPKVPELRWDEYGTLMLGDPEDGIKSGEVMLNANGTWRGCTSSQWIVWDAATEPEARAAVEAAVRKALGWEA